MKFQNSLHSAMSYIFHSVKGGVCGFYNFQDGYSVAIRDAPFGTHRLQSDG